MDTRLNPLTAATRFDTATLHEAAGKFGALPWQIKPVSGCFRVCGPAVPVLSPPGDNLWLHRAICAACPGDVLVVNVNGAHGHGYWGEIMSTAAKMRGLAGLVIDGCVRDGALLKQIGFPVFARGLCITGTGKDFAAHGTINEPITMAGVTIRRGDLIVGDGDGVVCLPADRLPSILAAAMDRGRFERKVIERLETGESTLTIYGWDKTG